MTTRLANDDLWLSFMKAQAQSSGQRLLQAQELRAAQNAAFQAIRDQIAELGARIGGSQDSRGQQLKMEARIEALEAQLQEVMGIARQALQELALTKEKLSEVEDYAKMHVHRLPWQPHHPIYSDYVTRVFTPLPHHSVKEASKYPKEFRRTYRCDGPQGQIYDKPLPE